MDRLHVVSEMLVLRAQGGDREAFGRLAVLWSPVLRRRALRLVGGVGGGAEWADEAVQEGWVSIAKGLGGLEDPRAFGAWAERIVARRVADRVRARRRERCGLRGVEASEREGERADRPDADGDLSLAIATLSSEHRDVLAARYGRGMSESAMASAFGVSVGTVKSRLSRAKRRLRAALERMDSDGTWY